MPPSALKSSQRFSPVFGHVGQLQLNSAQKIPVPSLISGLINTPTVTSNDRTLRAADDVQTINSAQIQLAIDDTFSPTTLRNQAVGAEWLVVGGFPPNFEFVYMGQQSFLCPAPAQKSSPPTKYLATTTSYNAGSAPISASIIDLENTGLGPFETIAENITQPGPQTYTPPTAGFLTVLLNLPSPGYAFCKISLAPDMLLGGCAVGAVGFSSTCIPVPAGTAVTVEFAGGPFVASLLWSPLTTGKMEYDPSSLVFDTTYTADTDAFIVFGINLTSVDNSGAAWIQAFSYDSAGAPTLVGMIRSYYATYREKAGINLAAVPIVKGTSFKFQGAVAPGTAWQPVMRLCRIGGQDDR